MVILIDLQLLISIVLLASLLKCHEAAPSSELDKQRRLFSKLGSNWEASSQEETQIDDYQSRINSEGLRLLAELFRSRQRYDNF